MRATTVRMPSKRRCMRSAMMAATVGSWSRARSATRLSAWVCGSNARAGLDERVQRFLAGARVPYRVEQRAEVGQLLDPGHQFGQ